MPHPLRHSFILAAAACALCACADSDRIVSDLCPQNPNKTAPGECGCEQEDIDTDGDGVMDCYDHCPQNPNKTTPGACGCDAEDVDSDGDGVMDCQDLCPDDPNKTAPGVCECGTPDTLNPDTGLAQCIDLCPNNDKKSVPSVCGCAVEDIDSDGDGVMDCLDLCPNDANKTTPGICGCGLQDIDSDGDGLVDCLDRCPDDPNKQTPGACGCGDEDSIQNLSDSDGDGTIDCLDGCPQNPYKTAPGAHSCDELDTDRDGVDDIDDACPTNPTIQKKSSPDQDCNLSIVDGETIFAVYHASDLLRLTQDFPRPGDACTPNVDTKVCLPNEAYGRALQCSTAGTWDLVPCGICTPKPLGGITCTVTEDTPSNAIGSACNPASATKACLDAHTPIVCTTNIDGKGVLISNTQCDANATCEDGRCVSLALPAEPAENGTSLGEPCNHEFMPSCVDAQTQRTCVQNEITDVQCVACEQVTPDSPSICLQQSELPTAPKRVIKLMNDIHLGDALPIRKSSYGCHAHWNPILLQDETFDGNHKTIDLKNGNETCFLDAPFFGNIQNAQLKNVQLQWNASGPSAIAHTLQNATLDHVRYNGLGGGKHPTFTTLANTVSDSTIDHLDIASEILDCTKEELCFGLAQSITHSVVSNLNFQVDQIVSESQIFGLAFESRRTLYNDANITLGRVQGASGSAGFYDVEQNVFKNFNVTVDRLELESGAGFASYLQARFSDATIDIGDIAGETTVVGFVEQAEMHAQDSSITLGNITSSEHIAAGFAEMISLSLSNTPITIGNVSGKGDTFGFAGRAELQLEKSPITLKDVTSQNGNANGFALELSVPQNLDFKAGNISAYENAFGLAQSIESLQQSSITLGNVTATHGNAIGLAQVLQNFNQNTCTLGDVSTENGSYSVGIALSFRPDAQNKTNAYNAFEIGSIQGPIAALTQSIAGLAHAKIHVKTFKSTIDASSDGIFALGLQCTLLNDIALTLESATAVSNFYVCNRLLEENDQLAIQAQHVQARSSIPFHTVAGSLQNIALYIDAYTLQQSSPFILNIHQLEGFQNAVASGRSQTYSAVDDAGSYTDLRLETDGVVAYNVNAPVQTAKNIYYLERDASEPYHTLANSGADPANDYSALTQATLPYSLHRKPTTDGLITALNAALPQPIWTQKTIQEDGNAITIPWLIDPKSKPEADATTP